MENGSTDSLTDTLVTQPPPPKDSAQTAQNNIIREMVETERKYVQDLEIMQVCTSPIPSFGIPAHCEIGRNIQPRSPKQI